MVLFINDIVLHLDNDRNVRRPENKNIPQQDCFLVPHACAAYVNVINDPSPGLDISKWSQQGNCGRPERVLESHSNLPG